MNYFKQLYKKLKILQSGGSSEDNDFIMEAFLKFCKFDDKSEFKEEFEESLNLEEEKTKINEVYLYLKDFAKLIVSSLKNKKKHKADQKKSSPWDKFRHLNEQARQYHKITDEINTLKENFKKKFGTENKEKDKKKNKKEKRLTIGYKIEIKKTLREKTPISTEEKYKLLEQLKEFDKKNELKKKHSEIINYVIKDETVVDEFNKILKAVGIEFQFSS